MPAPFLIENGSDDYSFPDVNLALREPDGLLAVGGDLSQERILSAYRSGIFPWYSEGQPVLWWSPDPRSVLFPEKLKISRSLRKTINRKPFEITLNEAFGPVINACSSVRREGQDGTWITDTMIHSYNDLHQSGYAHSVEAWQNKKLVGGLYGIAIGEVFFGESMFSLVTDASKVAFVYFTEHLAQKGFRLIDCQVYTSHLESLGAEQIPRKRFIHLLDDLCTNTAHNPFELTI